MLINLKYHLLARGSEFLTSGFRPPNRPDHTGTDWISKAGAGNADDIVTPFSGKVIEMRNTVPGNSTVNETGNYVLMDLGNGFAHRFCHMKLKSICVSVGQQVSAGSKIGTMGYTGHTIPTGPGGTHLHYDFRKNNVKIDPIPYLLGKETIGQPLKEEVVATLLTNTEVARQIINGTNNWGNGQTRVNNLRAKGYNAEAVQAEVNRIIREGTSFTAPTITPAPTPIIKQGSTVMLKPGCTDYSGRGLREFLFARKYKVSELKGDRAVITYGGVVVAAVRTNNLILL